MPVCIDDATRLAYVEILVDEKALTAVGFLRWAYGAIYRDRAEPNASLAGWLDFYNRRRSHRALSHKPPSARLDELNNLLGSYT